MLHLNDLILVVAFIFSKFVLVIPMHLSTEQDFVLGQFNGITNLGTKSSWDFESPTSSHVRNRTDDIKNR